MTSSKCHHPRCPQIGMVVQGCRIGELGKGSLSNFQSSYDLDPDRTCNYYIIGKELYSDKDRLYQKG